MQLLNEMCGGVGMLKGAEVGSGEVTFCPQAITGGEHVADTKTAGYVIIRL